MLFLLAVIGLSSAWADTLGGTLIDPQYYVGSGLGTPCVTGCLGEPNKISNYQLDLYLPGGGQAAGPTSLLILGIPNYSGTAPTIGSISVTNSSESPTTTLSSAVFTSGGTKFSLPYTPAAGT